MALTSHTSPAKLKLVDPTSPPAPILEGESKADRATEGEIMAAETDIHKHEHDYRVWLTRLHRSPRTITQWVWVLNKFTHWLERDPLTATRRDIEAWLFVHKHGLAPASIRNYSNALASFYRWAQREELCDSAPTDLLDRPKETAHAPDPCPTHLVRAALNAACPEMRAMIACAAFQGMRCAEIAAMNWVDIGTNEVMVHGKGRKERRIPIHPEVRTALAGLPKTGAQVFPEWSAHKVSQQCSAFLRALGVTTRMPMHSMRSWYATTLYRESGHDLLLVRDMLGHSSTEHTARYAQVEPDAALAAVSRMVA